MSRIHHPLSSAAVVFAAASLLQLFFKAPLNAAAAPPLPEPKPAIATTAGSLALTDNRGTITFNLPDGFTESEPSSATHRTLKTTESVTHLTLLPADQPTDPGSAEAFVEGTTQTLKQAKGDRLLATPMPEPDSKFAMIMHHRVQQSPERILDTTTRWRRVGPLAVQAVTEVSSSDETVVKSVNEAMAAMVLGAVVPGFEQAAATAVDVAAPVPAAEVFGPAASRQKFGGGAIEFSLPPQYEQISTSRGDASRDYLSRDRVTNIILTVLPPGTVIDARFGPTQLLTAKRELNAGLSKPTAGPEPITGAALPVEIKWSFMRDGQPAQGFRLFRKVGPQVVRAELTTTGEADAARLLGQQVLNSMTSLLPDEPPAAAPAAAAVAPVKPTRPLSGPAAERLNQRAQAALDQAKKLAADGKDDDAYARYRMIANEYPGATASGEAREAIARYEADPVFAERRKKPAEVGPAEKAASILSLADNYATAGKVEEARAKYQQILKDYGDTPAAVKVKKRLADLDKPAPTRPPR